MEDPLTQLLARWKAGDRRAGEHVFDRLYPVLRAAAHRRLREVGHPLSIDSVDMVNEAYLRLAEQRRQDWDSREHFLALAAIVLRRVLVDHLRHRNRLKRGGAAIHQELDEVVLAARDGTVDLLALDEALNRLETIHSEAARVVELRYFAGLDHDETAAALSIGRATVARRWRFARAFLQTQLGESEG